MNRYALSAESRRWWLPSAAAGLAASSAIAVIALVPVSTYAASSEPRDRGSAVSAQIADDADGTRYRACFMIHPNWPTLDGPQPRCILRGRGADTIQVQDTAGATRGFRRLEAGV
jgi:hypothetical protein